MVRETATPEKMHIIEKKSLTLVGCVFYGDPFHSKRGWDVENEIGLLWQRFMSLYENHKDTIEKYRVHKSTAYEVHIQPEEYSETKKFYVYVGVEVEKLGEMPLEMFSKIFPETMYAVFTFRGTNVFKGGEYIWKEWLPNSGYEEAYPYVVLAYEKGRFYGLDDENSEIDYYVPVRRKEGSNGGN